MRYVDYWKNRGLRVQFRHLAFVTLIATASAPRAALLVVSQQGANASDNNAGTEAQPLKTISAAALKVQPGDRVVIHRGDYRETVVVNASGTATHPIVFEAAAGERPVIKGSDIIAEWTRDDGCVWKTTLPALLPRSESGKVPAFWRSNDVRQIFVRDGEMLDAQRLRRVATRDGMQAGTFFSDVRASTIFVWLPDSGSPIDHPPEVSVRGAWLCVYGSHIVIRGLAMRHASTTALANWPACTLNGEDDSVENCIISWGDFAGISVSGKSNKLLRTTVACNGDSGGAGTGENHVIEGCRFLYNNVDRYNPGWHAGGAKFIPNFKHGTIRHNEFAHNLGPGLWLDGQCDGNVIDGNLAHDNEGAGIMVETSTGNLVMNNVSVTNRNVLSGLYRTAEGNEELLTLSEERIAPSRLVKPYHAGDGRGFYISTAPKTRVVHNTAYLNEAEGICVEGPPRSDGTGPVGTKDAVVKNNISVFNHGSQLTLRSDERGQEASSLSDYNLLFSVGAVFARTGWAGVSTFDLERWQIASGQDSHSLDADPRFALAAMDDFRVLAGSPALKAGKPLSEVGHDYFGQARGREGVTLGACEAVAQTYPRPLGNTLEGPLATER